jgi:hypothetical protein
MWAIETFSLIKRFRRVEAVRDLSLLKVGATALIVALAEAGLTLESAVELADPQARGSHFSHTRMVTLKRRLIYTPPCYTGENENSGKWLSQPVRRDHDQIADPHRLECGVYCVAHFGERSNRR